MDKITRAKRGFTLIEVAMSSFILVMVWIAAISTLILSRYATVTARHRVVAMYAAQQLIEDGRRMLFSGDENNYITQFSAKPVTIDPNGTITGTPKISVSTIDAHRKRLQLEIDWQEISPGGNRNMAEYCAVDISDESQLN